MVLGSGVIVGVIMASGTRATVGTGVNWGMSEIVVEGIFATGVVETTKVQGCDLTKQRTGLEGTKHSEPGVPCWPTFGLKDTPSTCGLVDDNGSSCSLRAVVVSPHP